MEASFNDNVYLQTSLLLGREKNKDPNNDNNSKCSSVHLVV